MWTEIWFSTEKLGDVCPLFALACICTKSPQMPWSSTIIRNTSHLTWTDGSQLLQAPLLIWHTSPSSFAAFSLRHNFYIHSAAPCATAMERYSPFSPDPWNLSHLVLSCQQEIGASWGCSDSKEDIKFKLGRLETKESALSSSKWRLERLWAACSGIDWLGRAESREWGRQQERPELLPLSSPLWSVQD